MTDQDAYRRYTDNAESLLAELAAGDLSALTAMALGSSAQTWATLALAAAQERVQPAGRPVDDTDVYAPLDLPRKVKDGEGDTWDLRYDDGLYWLTIGAESIQREGYTLEQIARDYGGYTEVT